MLLLVPDWVGMCATVCVPWHWSGPLHMQLCLLRSPRLGACGTSLSESVTSRTKLCPEYRVKRGFSRHFGCFLYVCVLLCYQAVPLLQWYCHSGHPGAHCA
jgi:hypothetical protein